MNLADKIYFYIPVPPAVVRVYQARANSSGQFWKMYWALYIVKASQISLDLTGSQKRSEVSSCQYLDGRPAKKCRVDMQGKNKVAMERQAAANNLFVSCLENYILHPIRKHKDTTGANKF